MGCGITVSNLGFHAPPNHPGFANDGTQGDAGFSNAAWTSNQTTERLTWSSETFAQNQNANAIRWGTLYNFRFDSDHPPQAANATIGFFKTGAPITVAIMGPTACDWDRARHLPLRQPQRRHQHQLQHQRQLQRQRRPRHRFQLPQRRPSTSRLGCASRPATTCSSAASLLPGHNRRRSSCAPSGHR